MPWTICWRIADVVVGVEEEAGHALADRQLGLGIGHDTAGGLGGLLFAMVGS